MLLKPRSQYNAPRPRPTAKGKTVANSLDLNTVKFKSVRNFVLPLSQIIGGTFNIVAYTTGLITVWDSSDKPIGFGVIKKLDGVLYVDFNLEYEIPERLDVDNNSYNLTVSFSISTDAEIQVREASAKVNTPLQLSLAIYSISLKA